MEYTALFEPTGSGAFVITFPDFGWGVSQGDDEEDARTMATALLQTLIQEHIRNGEPLPDPTKPRGRKYRVIRLQAMQDAKAELYRQFLSSGLRKSELARRLDIPKTVVDRLFNLNHHSRLPHIEAAFRALGKELTIEVRDAA
jgi:antitoxin HicB